MQSPWVTYYKKIEQLFWHDPDIETGYDEEANEVIIRVMKQEKADALMKLLPYEMDFGGVKLTIKVIPANSDDQDLASVFKAAFEDNPAFKDFVTTQTTIAGPALDYAVFEKKVVQFWNDNLGSPTGIASTLYEDIARDVLVLAVHSAEDSNTSIGEGAVVVCPVLPYLGDSG